MGALPHGPTPDGQVGNQRQVVLLLSALAAQGVGSMVTEARIKEIIDQAIGDFASSEPFGQLLSGQLSKDDLRQFIRNLFLPHYQSTRVLAFEYSVHGGPESQLLQHNMLEEIGLDDEGISHPALLETLALGAGYSPEDVQGLIDASRDQARAYYAQQLPFPTLRDLGLAILLESSSFECFLSQYADQIGEALGRHFGFSKDSLQWFELHGQLDLRHAEEALSVIRGYIEFHQLADVHFERIARATFAHNPFMARYFPEAVGGTPLSLTLPRQGGGDEKNARPQAPSARIVHAGGTAGVISAVTIYRLDLPFVSAFRHALASRAASDSVIVCIEDPQGNRGYGEGIAREYVTGESPTTMAQLLADELAPRLIAHSNREELAFEPLSELLARWRTDISGLNASAPPNAALCALELAIIDWSLRRAGKSLSELLPPARAEVEYSGVIPAEGPTEVAALALRFVEFGISNLKLKVGIGDDLGRVHAARQAAGAGARIRIDANGAWTPEEAIERLKSLQSLGIDCVEQPVSPAAGPAGLRRVREATGMAVVADESLVTIEDAQRLVEAQACDVFNLRVSKNGGLGAALAIAEVAQRAGIQIQVGAQVGETAVLSAAGRHLAAHLPDLMFAEGSFGTLLLEEDVAEQDLRFGPGGIAPVLRGPGLGIEIRQEQVERFAVEIIEVRP
ncbi:MAG TPA: enolase C-terminal domain-like protein [Chloroflexota bacterium]